MSSETVNYTIYNQDGDPGITFEDTSGDSVDQIATASLSSGLLNAQSMTITVDSGADIRYAFGVDPRQDGDGSGALGHIASVDKPVEVTSLDAITDFRYISKVSGAPATIFITIYYWLLGTKLVQYFDYKKESLYFKYKKEVV